MNFLFFCNYIYTILLIGGIHTYSLSFFIVNIYCGLQIFSADIFDKCYKNQGHFLLKKSTDYLYFFLLVILHKIMPFALFPSILKLQFKQTKV